ncbi:MAG: UDP-N-acetylmuramate dehydrogenase [Patescibacteria group bacterium]|nr:UDP-N-acetylmuramate dehydrogenase [Patescibacteria group bacterium]
MSVESKIEQNIPLAPLTTFKIGGPAKFFISVNTKEDLLGAYRWAKKNKEQVFILAGGSNVLINDNGVDGLVIKINNSGMAVKGERIECGAGASLSKAVRSTIGNNLSGLEWASGIPGAVGGAVRGNAGAYGLSMSDFIEIIEVFNKKKKKFEIFSNKDCKFCYRGSIFKKKNNYLIWSAVLKMKKSEFIKINSLIEKYSEMRAKNQPKLPSAGCVFKNLDFVNLRQNTPIYANKAVEAGAVKGGKVGAGWLINELGLKGKIIGGAKISLEHANFIVNTGKATAENVIMLISFIKQQVRTKFGVQLQEEIQYFGF